MALTKVTKELIQGGLGIDWQAAIKTGNFQSVASQGYFVNTTSNEVIVTMPPSPAIGDIVEIVDYAGTAQTNNIKITAQANINGSANDVKIDYQRGAVSIIYSGTAQGWLAEFAANDGTNALVDSPDTIPIQWLVVAGGGGGGSEYAAGGGAGGLRTSYGSISPITISGGSMESTFQAFQATSYAITVGGGGSGTRDLWPASNGPGANGANSIFATITSTGGGGGGTNTGLNGGSGGGAGCSGGTGNIGTAVTSPVVQGFNGGNRGSYSPKFPAGGGGGAKEVGYSASNQSTSGAGGDGLEINILGGTGNFYAGGGGGGGQSGVSAGSGGSSIGGSGTGTTIGGTAIVHTGSGGGGGGSISPGRAGGDGSSGIIILRYPTAKVNSYSTTGTLSTVTNGAYPIANKACYPLNGNVVDISGNGYNGTNNNVTFAAGIYAQAGVFNGTSAYVDTGISGTTVAWGYSAWIKTTVAAGAVLAQLNGSGSSSGVDMVVQSGGEFRCLFHQNGNAISSTYLFGTNINDGNWHFVAYTWDGVNGNDAVIRIDGTKYTQSTSITGGTNADATLKLGRFGASAGGGFFTGNISQVRVFTSKLSDAQLTTLYNEGYVRETTDGTDSILEFLGGTGNITFS